MFFYFDIWFNEDRQSNVHKNRLYFTKIIQDENNYIFVCFRISHNVIHNSKEFRVDINPILQHLLDVISYKNHYCNDLHKNKPKIIPFIVDSHNYFNNYYFKTFLYFCNPDDDYNVYGSYFYDSYFYDYFSRNYFINDGYVNDSYFYTCFSCNFVFNVYVNESLNE